MRSLEKYSLNRGHLTARTMLLQRRAAPAIRWCHFIASHDGIGLPSERRFALFDQLVLAVSGLPSYYSRTN